MHFLETESIILALLWLRFNVWSIKILFYLFIFVKYSVMFSDNIYGPHIFLIYTFT